MPERRVINFAITGEKKNSYDLWQLVVCVVPSCGDFELRVLMGSSEH